MESCNPQGKEPGGHTFPQSAGEFIVLLVFFLCGPHAFMTGNHFCKGLRAIDAAFLGIPVESFPNIGRNTCRKPLDRKSTRLNSSHRT